MSILFYSAKEVPYGCFSNFSAHKFTLEGIEWRTTEHYFQAMKFYPHWEHINAIRVMPSPTEWPLVPPRCDGSEQATLQAAKAGRSRERPLRADWEEVKDDMMRKAVLAKFEQHPDIAQILLDTGDQELIENTTNDHYWGCGTTGTGKNMLGIILMETRDILRSRLQEKP